LIRRYLTPRKEGHVALISVIIPVYNGENTIEQTIRSVLDQTYSDFELIIIDDGSTDHTLDLIEKIQDPRIRVFPYENAGLSASRNRGIKHANGEYVSFLDADDLWTPDKLKAQLDALIDNPEAAVSYSWTAFIDMDGNLLDYGIQQSFNGYVYPNLLTYFFIGSGSNALIKKQVFDDVGLFDETLKSAEDRDIFLRIAEKYFFAAVPVPQILYRITENSMSRNVIRQERESIKVIERAYAQDPGKSLSFLRRSTYANLYIYLAAQALKGNPDRRNGLTAAKFLWISIRNGLQILQQFSYVSVLVIKILSVILLPPQQAKLFRSSVKRLTNRFRQ
jgi:glycosyltransferase involved in cell wall biosynthesis